MQLRASSRRTMGPWMKGPQDACHPDTLEVCLVVHGRIRAVLGGRTVTQRPGEVAVIPPGVVHSCWTEDEGAEEVVLHLEGAPDVPVGVHAGLDVDALLHAASSEDVLVAVTRVLRAIGPTPTVDPRLDRLLHALRTRLHEPWTVPEMARTAAMSERSLRRAFRGELDSTPARWLEHLRIERAKELLEAGRPVADVAEAVGYRTPSRLSEAFGRTTGVRPSAWPVRCR